MRTTYQETLTYLYDNLPMFQRVGAVALKNDLTNTLKLCEALGNPQYKFKAVHIAGTNGKGSTSHMLASVFQSAGYKTGLYTSPHLKEFTERIRVNGDEIQQAFIIDFVNRIQPTIEEVMPSFFEITVAMAFDYFVQEKVDIAIIEVGLGGRLDSTNVIVPELSLITNIGWDHKEILGDTLQKIASEKAGIIKPGVPVVISERQQDVESVFIEKANSCSSPINFASDELICIQHEESGVLLMDILKQGKVIMRDLAIPLQGFYQRKNVAGVLKAILLLRALNWKISDDNVRKGLEMVTQQTGLKGRWQKLGNRPLVICDTGHNVEGVTEVVAQIQQQRYRQLHIVWGMVKDKDVSAVLKLLPKEAKYYFCQADIPRAMNALVLSEKAKEEDLDGEVIQNVNDAIMKAKSIASPDDMIFIGGSTFVVAGINDL
jgi:dihydrofolate synthase/folylpolyglutamate synthase